MLVADPCQNLQLIQDTVPHRDLDKEKPGREVGAEQTAGFQRTPGGEESLDLESVVGEHYHQSFTDS